uniref:Clathrin light chain n=1 Tax=Dromaius novaehollandiae TaxID=8790 RepID=A0A8C4KET9_DRONO
MGFIHQSLPAFQINDDRHHSSRSARSAQSAGRPSERRAASGPRPTAEGSPTGGGAETVPCLEAARSPPAAGPLAAPTRDRPAGLSSSAPLPAGPAPGGAHSGSAGAPCPSPPPGPGQGAAAEEDPAAAFLAQQENEIAGIENDEGFGPTDGEAAPASAPPEPGERNCVLQESNGPTDAYAAIAKADRLTQEPESIRKWREEQKKRLEELDAASKVTEQEWREKAKKDLEEWNLRQNEQMEKNRANNRASEEAFLKESKEEAPGSEWEKVAQLCDFNPKSSKQSKDVSRMRSVLISLKQTPLSR